MKSSLFAWAATRAQRLAWGVFRDRRPELYTPLLSLDGRQTSSSVTSPIAAAAGFSPLSPHAGSALAPVGLPSASLLSSPSHHAQSQSQSLLLPAANSSAQLTVPARDGFRMPAEWETQARCWLLWPVRPGTWRNNAKYAQGAHAFAAADCAVLGWAQSIHLQLHLWTWHRSSRCISLWCAL